MPTRGSGALPDYAEREEIPLRAAREIGPAEIALAAAKAGALGGAVGPTPRAMISYEDWMSGIKNSPLVFRGMRVGPVDDPLAINPDPARKYRKAAYGSPSITEASTYVGDEGVIYPIRLHPKSVSDYEETLIDEANLSQRARRVQAANRISDWNRAAAAQPPGEVLVHRTLEERSRGPEPSAIGDDYYYQGGEPHYAWTEGTRGTPFSPIKKGDAAEYVEAAAKRIGRPLYDPETYASWLDTDLYDTFQEEADAQRFMTDAEEARKFSFDRGVHDEAIKELQNDPRFLPTNAARARQFLKGMATEALRPVNLLKDAAWGAGAGALSAVAGYESARPTSGGRFLPPGPGYENVESVEDILAVAAQKELEREARRRQYIKEARAMGEAASDDARVSELANILGPIR